MAFKVPYLLLADGAYPMQQGKLSIMGTFEVIYVAKLPTRYQGFVIVFLIVAENDDDLGQHDVTFRVERPGGRVLAEVQSKVRFQPTGTGGYLSTARGVIGIQGIPFHEYGRHRVVILVDGNELSEHPIVVQERATSTPK